MNKLNEITTKLLNNYNATAKTSQSSAVTDGQINTSQMLLEQKNCRGTTNALVSGESENNGGNSAFGLVFQTTNWACPLTCQC